ncbi:LCP family protein [Streptacidiphilus jiangxiensis]|uniref:Cell envelope-related function transcriptional attenuator common domain-containing protein n=1 Tax=Streptacidiphilus jiangxiensis TaxID=235985 RepID=A0A1H7PTQ0_STRJI|nr:LCP family protein [Streptacidiphilus jiangxiensis]SEL38635.1 cell envelope-related function transcriptional attenuator common domain-containing protein [Streptacidiphilus jiangxiensis]
MADRPQDRPQRRPSGRPSGRPSDRTGERDGDRPGERPADRVVGRRPATPLVRAGRAVVATASAVVLLGSGVSWFTYHSLTDGLNTSDALGITQRHAPPKLDNSINLLLIGLDSRKDMNGNDLPKQFVEQDLHAGSSDIGGYNTNTLILLHIPANGGKVQAFSIPRDDYVETLNGDGTSQGHHKIKEAYGLAKAAVEPTLKAQGVTGAALEQQSREAGREATLATVQQFLGVRIDHFAEVNLLGFYDIAKVVQPITVCLKHATKDPAMTGQGSGADFHAGYNTLDAAGALSFVRQRHNLTNGDLDRTHRQQAFISSVMYKLKQEGLFNDLGKMQGLFDVVKQDVVLDSQWNVLDFAQQVPNLTGGNVVFNTLPIQGFATRNGESVNLVDAQQIQRIMQRLISVDPSPAAAPSTTAPAPAPASGAQRQSTPVAPAAVDVLNGSGVTGLAAQKQKDLVDAGWTAGRTGNATARAHTVIRYGSGADAAKAAKQVAAKLGVSAVPTASANVAAGHVEVLLGADAGAAGGTSGSSSDSAATGGTTSSIPFQGASVDMGKGIPCVD